MVSRLPSLDINALRLASAELPPVLAGWMLRALEGGEFTIGSGAYESELAMCPVAAAVTLAERHEAVPSEWDPAWRTEADFGARVVAFVDAFDNAAEGEGLEQARRCIVDALRQAGAPFALQPD
jgi:hypothetical protein